MNKNFKNSALFLVAGFVSYALQAQEVPKGWHMMDKASSGYYGISIDKVDDEKFGQLDDVYCWNFLGGRDGKNVEQDSYEAARVYHNLKAKYAELKDVSMLSVDELFYYDMWARAKQEIVGDVNPMEIIQIRRMSKMMAAGDSVIRKSIKKEEYNCKDLENYTTEDADAKKVKDILIRICEGNDNNEITNQQILDQLEADLNKMEASDIAPKNYRADVVKDNYKDFNDKFYGNNNVMVSNKSALHGTHVSGIIGAARNNGKGMDGVADNVRIMTLRQPFIMLLITELR